MDIQEIYRIWDRFDQSDVTELELELDQAKFALKRNHTAKKTTSGSYVAETEMKSEIPVKVKNQNQEKEYKKEQENKNTAADKNGKHTSDEEATGIAVKAPLVGTYYCAPAPDADAFVTIGQKVNKGDVVAIVEAMKMMNEVVAPVDGIVSAIYVEDEQLVEFEQTLLLLEEI